MWKSLATKVGVRLGIILLMVGVFGWDLSSDMDRIKVEFEVITKSNTQSHMLHSIEMQLKELIEPVKVFLVTNNYQSSLHFNQQYQQLQDLVVKYEQLYAYDALLHMRNEMVQLKKNAEYVFQLPQANNNMESPIVFHEILAQTSNIMLSLSAQHHALDDQVNRAMQMTNGLSIDIRQETIALFVILLMALIWFTYYIYKQVVMPLIKLKQSTHRIGEGNFEARCPVTSEDEIGELGKSFNLMGKSLQERESKLNKARNLAAHQEKMKALGVMTSGIAHEVGNPLASIAMLLQLTLRKLSQHNVLAAETQISEALKETERMESIIQTVLNFGRLESNQDFQYVELKYILGDAIHFTQMLPQNKKVKIQINVDRSLPSVFVSSGMLMQVLVNLLDNACYACNAIGSGYITIHGYEENDMVVVDVSDTGEGIPEELGVSIFEPSFTTKAKGSGTGLGLAISKELMDAMRGSLTLVAPHKNGTCFRLCLPTQNKAGLA
ncbi:MAG: HAMP domain-containing sensor histidine kinase [Ghiorsea sp.]